MRLGSIFLASVAVTAPFCSTTATAQARVDATASVGERGPGQRAADGSVEQDAPTDTTSGDIIVTAQKRAERLQDVPKTVDVIPGDTVQKLNLRQFSEIQQLAPGLSLTPKDSVTNSVTLRGVAFDPNSGTASTVDVYFNEVPISLFSAFKAIYDVGQIEVLRGPQGTLRGRTSPGGAITIASARPSLTAVDGYVQQTLSTQDGINTQGAVSVPLIDGVLAVRASGLFDRNIGAGVANISNGRKDRERTESGRVSVAFRPTGGLDVIATYQHLANRTSNSPLLFTVPGATTTPMLVPSDRIGKVRGPGEGRFVGDQLTLGAQWDLGGVALNYVGGYQNTKLGRETDLANGGSIAGSTQTQVADIALTTWTQELRLASQRKRTWNWLIGGFYSDTKGQTFVTQPQFFAIPGVPAPGFRFNVGVDTPGATKDYAVFTDHRFQVTAKDLIEVGVRYQKQDFDRRFTVTLTGLGPAPIVQQGISPANQRGSYDQVTGSASWKHDFSRDLTAYVNYARSYRPGGVNATTSALDEGLLLFDPETSNAYELGLKGALADRRVTFALSLFAQDFTNYQAYTGAFLAVSTTRSGTPDNNAAFVFNADARVRGVEASVTTRIGDRLRLGLGGNYADATFKNALAPCNDFNGDGVPDSVGVPRVPVGQQVALCRQNGRLGDQAPWNVSLNVEYAVPVGAGRDFFVRGLANYVPKRRDPFTEARYGDLLNNSVFLGFRGADGSYELSFFAKNLANVATVLTRNAQQLDYSTIATGYATATVTRPREFGLVGRVAF